MSDKKPVIALSGSELVDLVKSREFRSRLAEAARITMRTGYESGFRHYLDLDANKRYWTPVFKGERDELPSQRYSDWKSHTIPSWPADRCVELLTFHTHPDADRELGLSYDDLRLILDGDSDFDLRPLIAIAGVTESTSAHLLLLRRTCDHERALGLLPVILDEMWAA